MFCRLLATAVEEWRDAQKCSTDNGTLGVRGEGVTMSSQTGLDIRFTNQDSPCGAPNQWLNLTPFWLQNLRHISIRPVAMQSKRSIDSVQSSTLFSFLNITACIGDGKAPALMSLWSLVRLLEPAYLTQHTIHPSWLSSCSVSCRWWRSTLLCCTCDGWLRGTFGFGCWLDGLHTAQEEGDCSFTSQFSAAAAGWTTLVEESSRSLSSCVAVSW